MTNKNVKKCVSCGNYLNWFEGWLCEEEFLCSVCEKKIDELKNQEKWKKKNANRLERRKLAEKYYRKLREQKDGN